MGEIIDSSNDIGSLGREASHKFDEVFDKLFEAAGAESNIEKGKIRRTLVLKREDGATGGVQLYKYEKNDNKVMDIYWHDIGDTPGVTFYFTERRMKI